MPTESLFRPRIADAGDNLSPPTDKPPSTTPAGFTSSKVVCVGRNYSEHAKELNNPVPQSPLLFIKPETSLCHFSQRIMIPANYGECHHELELALLIGKTLRHVDAGEVANSIAGVGLALDLTLRDLQSKLKSKGQPWEKAKAFDGSCPVSAFISVSDLQMPLHDTEFALKVNGDYRQQGQVRDMIFPIDQLVAEMSQHFTLRPGDIVLTGTPAGVAALSDGDALLAELNGILLASATVQVSD